MSDREYTMITFLYDRLPDDLKKWFDERREREEAEEDSDDEKRPAE